MLTVAALPAVGVAILPLVYLLTVARDSDRDRLWQIMIRPRTVELLAASVQLAAVVALATAVVGGLLAWLVERTDLPGRRLVGLLAPLPLAIPSYVAAYTWMSHSDQLAGFPAAVLVLTASTYPYVYLTVSAALRGMDPAGEEVARSLGRGPVSTFARVVLPQLRPSLAAGGLLVALYVLSDYGSVSITRYDTFTRVIYTSLNGFDRVPAVVMSLLLVALTSVIVLAEIRTRGRARYARVGAGSPRPERRRSLGRMTIPALAFTWTVLGLALAAPGATLAYWLMVGRSRNFDWSALVTAASNSALLAALGALLTLVLALPIGLLAARPGVLGRGLEAMTYFGHAVPSVVLGLSLVFFALRVVPELYQTVPLVALAYAVLFLPLASSAIRTSALQCPPVLHDVSRTLEPRASRRFLLVTARLTAPGIAVGGLLVFLTAMKELTATLMLRPTGMDTLAVGLWSEAFTRSYAAAAPYAFLLVLVSVVPALLLSRAARPRRSRSEFVPGGVS